MQGALARGPFGMRFVPLGADSMRLPEPKT
jgi:hypothetical protein